MRCDWTATNSTSKSNKRTRALVPFLSLLICIAAGSVSAQKTPQPAGGGMTTQPGPGGPGQQSGGANAANAPNNGPQGGGSTGIEPIEASILAYRLLGATSHVIAQAVDSAVQNGDTLLAKCGRPPGSAGEAAAV